MISDFVYILVATLCTTKRRAVVVVEAMQSPLPAFIAKVVLYNTKYSPCHRLAFAGE